MSFLKNLVDKVEVDLGDVGAALTAAHLSAVTKVLTNIDNVLKNPIVDGVLGTVLDPQITKLLPQFTTVLDKAIVDLTIATKIAGDIAAATSTEAKLIIFLKDLQAENPIIKSALLDALCGLMLAALGNNVFSAQIYAIYASCKNYLATGKLLAA